MRSTRPTSRAARPVGRPMWLRLAVLAVLLQSCAKQVFPPGGPEDKTPPRVIEASPAAYAAGVRLDAKIWVAFSEAMDRRTTEQSIFVAPNPGDDMDFRWWRNKVTVGLPGTLEPGRTYVVTVGTGAEDQHRNRLAASYSFAFSTGPTLDRGSIYGRVAGIRGPELPEARASAALPGRSGTPTYIWAYDVHKGDLDPSTNRPGYTTQTDQQGFYTLRFLSPGTYRVFAFTDTDRDREYTPEKDALGVPANDVVLSSGADSIGLGDLYPTRRDTTLPRLISARAPDNTHVVLRFSEPVRVAKHWVSISGALAVLEVYYASKDSTRLHCLTEGQTPEKDYSVTLEQGVDLAGNPLAPDASAASFAGSAAADTVRPKLAWIAPPLEAQEVGLNQEIEVHFDEAMSACDLDSAFWSAGDSAQAPSGTLRWDGPVTLRFLPGTPWLEGHTYALEGDGTRLRDRADNALADSSFEVSFSTLREEDMGTFTGIIYDDRMGGQGDFHLLAGRIRASGAARSRSPSSYHWVVPDTGAYTSGAMSPGDYEIRAFRDEDANGAWSAGTPLPFAPAERWIAYPDTVTIRARWETANVNMRFNK